MTEDMRERFEKLAVSLNLGLYFAWEQGRGYIDPDTWKAFAIFEAALSSAGTSGTARCGQKFYSAQTRNTYICVLPKCHDGDCDDCENRGNLQVGDSLSGKGEATKEVNR